MYEIDKLDQVVELKDVPQQDVGAPMPIVLADDYRLLLSYLLTNRGAALITFGRPSFHLLGGPNDEALSGHPLYAIGLGRYGAYEVLNSSLARRLERMNSVHPSHNPKNFEGRRHFVFTFKEHVFECVARSFEAELIDEDGRIDAMVARFRELKR